MSAALHCNPSSLQHIGTPIQSGRGCSVLKTPPHSDWAANARSLRHTDTTVAHTVPGQLARVTATGFRPAG